MYKLIVFNCLIGNGDAHLKNFALQYTPDKAELIKLAECGEFKMRDAEQIIERLAAGILDYLSKSNEVKLFVGLRQSIELSVSKVMSVNFTQNTFRHDKNANLLKAY